jgi:hypothetical protein
MRKILIILLLFPSLAFSQATGKIIANRPSGGTLSIDTINAGTLFNLAQTTASQTIVIPSLISGAKTIYIRNIGSVSVTLSPGGSLATGGMLIYGWTGAAWSVSAGSSGGGGGVDTTAIHKTGNETIRSGIKTFAVPPSVPTPATGADATNKGYVDGKLAAKQDTGTALLLDGTKVMSNNLNMGGNYVINVDHVKVNDGGGLYANSNNANISLSSDGSIGFIGTSISATSVPYLNASKKLVSSTTTPTELSYVHGVTSDIQTQLDSKTNADTSLLGHVAKPLSQFASTTSAQLASTISNETGSGALVFGTSPTLTTPALGTPSALVGTNITGLPLTTGVTGLLPDANISSASTWNAKASAASVAAKRDTALASGKIVVGQTYGGGLAVTPSGGFTMTNAGVATLSNSEVITKLLTGYSSGAGTVSSSDNILQAIQKLNGNIAANTTSISTNTTAISNLLEPTYTTSTANQSSYTLATDNYYEITSNQATVTIALGGGVSSKKSYLAFGYNPTVANPAITITTTNTTLTLLIDGNIATSPATFTTSTTGRYKCFVEFTGTAFTDCTCYRAKN